MRIIELSNHPEAERRRIQAQRLEEVAAIKARHEEALAEHCKRVDELRQEQKRTRSEHRWWTALKQGFAVWLEKQRPPRRPSLPTVATHQEEKLSAGAEGEQIAAAAFNAALDDRWTLIRGYRNNRGEIDQILLGPNGLFTVEIKHINGIISYEGDRWWRERLDKYGNHVGEAAAIADGQGRSPSRQINESTDVLQQLLQAEGHSVTIKRAILFTHPRSRRGDCNQQTVDLITNSPDALLKCLHSSPATLQSTQLAQIVDLTTRDHQRHNARRRPKRTSRARA